MKRPAYAHALLAARRAGHHPDGVTVVYGGDWRVAAGVTRLAVKPGAALGLDWGCGAGLPVDIVDRRRGEDGGNDELFRLAGEIARVAATVTIEADGWRCCAHEQAYLQRILARPLAWPQWWSEEIDELNERNRRQWFREAEAYLAQFAA